MSVWTCHVCGWKWTELNAFMLCGADDNGAVIKVHCADSAACANRVPAATSRAGRSMSEQCPSTIIGHRCYLEAGHDSDHEDAQIWWGDPMPGVRFTEPGNPFSPVWHRADNLYSVKLDPE